MGALYVRGDPDLMASERSRADRLERVETVVSAGLR